MIDKMADSYYEMRPLTAEQFSTSPVISFLDDTDDKNFSDDYHFLSDDHWKKFELDFPELSNIDDIVKELTTCDNSSLDCLLNTDDPNRVFLNNHDCMWAGHCGSKEHAEEPKSNLGFFVPKPPILKPAELKPATATKLCATGKQQSLLKPSVKAMTTTTNTFIPSCSTSIIQHTPQTPPESDDEENKDVLLKILKEAIDDCDLEDDSDLCKYLEDKEVGVKEEHIDIKEEPLDDIVEEEEEAEYVEEEEEEEEEESMSYLDAEQLRIRSQLAAENDHSYHKDRNAAMRLNNYGLDTPSESEEEEEIDVVSVTDKFGSNASRMVLSLPTNPSHTDRHNLQRRMATAMSRKHMGDGIKTLLPVRNPVPNGTIAAPKPGRVGKRGRGTRTNAGYKRRRMNDTNREPTDKRHLHNDMERQRRVDLRIAFENLKSVVPEVSGTKKIAKVNILLQAAQYCYYLTGSSANYNKQLEDLRKRQVWLRQRVSQLRRNLAARR